MNIWEQSRWLIWILYVFVRSFMEMKWECHQRINWNKWKKNHKKSKLFWRNWYCSLLIELKEHNKTSFSFPLFFLFLPSVVRNISKEWKNMKLLKIWMTRLYSIFVFSIVYLFIGASICSEFGMMLNSKRKNIQRTTKLKR